MDDSVNPDSIGVNPVISLPIQNFSRFNNRKFIIITATLILLTILLSLSYYIYNNYFLHFKTLAVLNYDSQKAALLLKNKDTIAFTRKGQLLIGNLAGEELLLIPSLSLFGQRIADIKISKSGNYITFESEKGILGLNIKNRDVFLINSNKPWRLYDLSPLADKVLFFKDNQLVEANLSNSYFNLILSSLPPLENPHREFNQVKYSPNGNLAYLRSIPVNFQIADDPDRKKGAEFIINLKTKKITWLPNEFRQGVSLTPVWSNDSDKLLTLRNNNLILYSLKDNKIESLVEDKNLELGAYSFSPDDNNIAFITCKGKIKIAGREECLYPGIILMTLSNNLETTLIKSNNLELRDHNDNANPGAIREAGWLNNHQLYFTVIYSPSSSDLWIIDKAGGNLKRALKNFSEFSFDSIYYFLPSN